MNLKRQKISGRTRQISDSVLERVRSYKFQRNCKLQVFILKLGVVNYELNLEMQFSKKFAQSKFETASY